MSKTPTFIFSALFSFSSVFVVDARASDDVSYCHSLPELARNVKSCSQNLYFSKAAELCLSKIERDIAAKKLLLAAAMQQRGANAGSAQASRIENNSQNLSELRSSIESLTRTAIQARLEVTAYSENFDLAGPFDPKTAEKLGILKLLRGFPCFKNNRAALVQVVSALDTRIVEFRGIAASARAMEAKDTANLKKLDSSSLNASVSARSPASTGAPVYAAPPPVKKSGPSSITGTEKIGESERALQKLQQK